MLEKKTQLINSIQLNVTRITSPENFTAVQKPMIINEGGLSIKIDDFQLDIVSYRRGELIREENLVERDRVFWLLFK